MLHPETGIPATDPLRPGNRRQRSGLAAGPLVAFALLLLPAPEGMSAEAWHTVAVGSLMAIWWVTEALPLAVTALLPLVLFPVLGILTMRATAAPYANPIIFLFLGGFIIALAMQRWGLHRRLALAIVQAVGTRADRLVLGLMLASAFVSMWVSNTATVVMMLPIGLSIVQLVQGGHDDVGDANDAASVGRRNFAVATMLGIAYASSIGGLATLIGTPPNALLAAFLLESYGFEIGFGRWMLVGVPLVAITLPLAWLLLTRVAFPAGAASTTASTAGGAAAVRDARAALGRVSTPEKLVASVFAATALLWVTRPLLEDVVPGISDTGIAMAAAVVLFMLPTDRRMSGFVMTWDATAAVPWGVLLLFGGGLALAEAVTATGLAEWIAGSVAGLDALPTVALVLGVTTLIILLTELTSNTATAAAFLPFIASLALGLGENPLLLVIPAAIAASCAFMMPVATPPNAIVYGSGHVTIPQMIRAGWWLNLLFIVAITLLVYTLVALVFGVEAGVLPAWARSR
jgi:solute carrier family 13 (sodium-dependent dicarboxylate transporter), member 2/3/5